MKVFLNIKSIILIFFFVFSSVAFAVNPSAPFLPSDNIQDPGCLPTDSNCYVLLTSFTDENVTGLDYATSTGILSLTSGYVIPTVASTTAWNTAIGALGGSALLQNGNSFGNTLTLGTNDNQALSFETNGLSRITILNDGKVGIGITNPYTTLTNYGSNIMDESGFGLLTSQESFSWSSSGAGFVAAIENRDSNAIVRNGLLVKTAATDVNSYIAKFESGGVNKLTIRADGNVGVGTSSPTSKLTVWGNLQVGTSSTSAFSVNTATGNTYASSLNATTIKAGIGSGVLINNSISMGIWQSISWNNTFADPSIGGAQDVTLGRDGAAGVLQLNNGSLGSMFRVYNKNGTNYERAVFGWSANSLNIGSENGGTGLARSINFLTSNTTRLTIDTDGNVGVGTTTPTRKLDIYSSSAPTGGVTINSHADGDFFNALQLRNSQSSWQFSVRPSTDLNPGGFTFYRSATESIYSAVMALTTGGNVGIGTSTPDSKLSIAGGINLTGALRINGNSGTSGFVLQSTGTGIQWVATSTLGISGGGGVDVDALSLIEVGNTNIATGLNSSAFGYGNSALMGNSVLVGNQNFTSTNGTSSVALGILNNSHGALINTSTGVITGTAVATTTVGVGSTAVGVSNVSIGRSSVALGYKNTATGVENTTVGYQNYGSGSNSSALGYSNSATGERASAIGWSNIISGGIQYSSAFGYQNNISGAGGLNSSSAFGNGNTITSGQASAFGYGNSAAFSGVSFGHTNVVSAADSGIAFGKANTVSASGAVAIGAGITNSTSNSLMIGPSNTAKITILTSGNTGIGTTTPADRLQVFGDVRLGTTGTNGCIKDFGGTGITGTCSSDERLKTNIVDLSDGYLDKMNNLKLITYNWNNEANTLNKVDTTVTNYGLLAQNVESIFPELVSVDSNGYKQVNYSRIPLYLLKAVQELSKKVASIFDGSANIYGDTLKAKNQLCIEDVCVTKQQLQQILQNPNVQNIQPAPIVNTEPEVVPPVVDEVVVETEPVVEPTPEPEVVVTPEIIEIVSEPVVEVIAE